MSSNNNIFLFIQPNLLNYLAACLLFSTAWSGLGSFWCPFFMINPNLIISQMEAELSQHYGVYLEKVATCLHYISPKLLIQRESKYFFFPQ